MNSVAETILVQDLSTITAEIVPLVVLFVQWLSIGVLAVLLVAATVAMTAAARRALAGPIDDVVPGLGLRRPESDRLPGLGRLRTIRLQQVVDPAVFDTALRVEHPRML